MKIVCCFSFIISKIFLKIYIFPRKKDSHGIFPCKSSFGYKFRFRGNDFLILSDDISRCRNVCVERTGIVVYGYFIKTSLSAATYFFGFGVKRRSLNGRKIDDLRSLCYRWRLLEIGCDRKGIVCHNEKHTAHHLSQSIFVLIFNPQTAFCTASPQI